MTDALNARVAAAVTSTRVSAAVWLADGPRGKRMTSMLGEEACFPTSLLAFVALQSEASLGVFLHERRERSPPTTLLPAPAGSAGGLTAYPAYSADVSRLSRRRSRRPSSA